ncbi:hypothetical protein SEA_BIG4_300 [Microbacterium phage Big4]|nr:hypothetical protein SEA_BIG4_300 [Microbacterium phage Big4]
MAFRRPFMVESSRRLYNGLGLTDPERQSFAHAEDAVEYLDEMLSENRIAIMFFRNPETGEWEE